MDRSSKRDLIEENKSLILIKDNDEAYENYLNKNIYEELIETKRDKEPKNTLYNQNNISYINEKIQINEENIDESDDEGCIRKTNNSVSSLNYFDIYKNKNN